MTIVLLGDGEERLEIMIPILNDNIVENSENFTLNFTVISDSGNIPFYQPSLANIQIIDDDGRFTPTIITQFKAGVPFIAILPLPQCPHQL